VIDLQNENGSAIDQLSASERKHWSHRNFREAVRAELAVDLIAAW
jgi:hypothetical protein